MQIVKGYRMQINGGQPVFISEETYNKLIDEYDKTCSNKTIIESTEDYFTTLYRFDKERNVVRLGWAFYPLF